MGVAVAVLGRQPGGRLTTRRPRRRPGLTFPRRFAARSTPESHSPFPWYPKVSSAPAHCPKLPALATASVTAEVGDQLRGRRTGGTEVVDRATELQCAGGFGEKWGAALGDPLGGLG